MKQRNINHIAFLAILFLLLTMGYWYFKNSMLDRNAFDEIAKEELIDHEKLPDNKLTKDLKNDVPNQSEFADEQKSKKTVKNDGTYADAPRDPFLAAMLAEWNAEVRLKPVFITFDNNCGTLSRKLSSDSIMRFLRDSLNVESEFPDKGNILRMDYAFGIPGPKTLLLRLQWTGDATDRYDILEQRTGNDKKSLDTEFRKVFENLDKDKAESQLMQLVNDYRAEYNKIVYRRVLITNYVPRDPDSLPALPENSASLSEGSSSAEIINDRILQFSNDKFNCYSVGRYSLNCKCYDNIK